MLVDIATLSNQVTIELRDGRRIVGELDDKDNIHILENTTSLDEKTAECAAGVALVSIQQDGQETMVWRRLMDKAHECKKHVDRIRYQTN
jgi:small nuclear ribonucleoprotein (snRNP)-like protein